MKKLYADLRKRATKTTNFEDKEIIPWQRYYKKRNKKDNNVVISAKKNSKNKKKKNNIALDHWHCAGKFRCASYNMCSLRYKTSKETSLVFRNGLDYNYHLIIKKLRKEFNGQFECLGENTKKYATYSTKIPKGN